MKISSAITLLVVSSATSAVAAANITYNVVSFQPDNQTVAVIVDNQVYPLTSSSEKSQLLYSGEAPVATLGYKYAVVDKSNTAIMIDQENFSRDPVVTDSRTLNEYYGRSWNTMNLRQLPTILEPLPIINRIKSDLHVDGEIPTIHITGNQSAIDNMHANQYMDIDVSELKMTYISPRDVKTFENITLAVSGFSSRSFSKLSYKLQLHKDGDDLYDYRRFKLRSMGIDFSYMREELSYAIAESIGLPVTRYSYVRVFLNDKPLGLFGFSDNLKNPWPRNTFAGGKKFNQGAIYTASPNNGISPSLFPKLVNIGSDDQADVDQNSETSPQSLVDSRKSDLTYLGNNITDYSQYSVREDPSSGAANYTRIMELCKFISEQSNATSSDAAISLWNEKIDVPSFLRGIAFEIVTSQSDAYLSNANNYVLYDDLENKRFVYSNQDFDISMGTALNAELMHGGNYSNFPGLLDRPLTSRLLAVPEFKKEIAKLVYTFARDLVNPDILYPRIDDLYTLLEQDVAWDKSLPRVGKVNILELFGANFTSDEIPFMFGLNGTMTDSSLSRISLSLKDWIQLRSTNLLKFFNETSTSITE